MSVDAGDPRFWRPARVSAKVDWPEVHSAGLAYEFADVTVMLDVKRIGWSRALKHWTLTLDEAQLPSPTSDRTNVLVLNMQFRDQTVFAVGLQYKPESVAYRFGYNYGRTPLTQAGASPFFAATNRTSCERRPGIEVRWYGFGPGPGIRLSENRPGNGPVGLGFFACSFFPEQHPVLRIQSLHALEHDCPARRRSPRFLTHQYSWYWTVIVPNRQGYSPAPKRRTGVIATVQISRRIVGLRATTNGKSSI